MLRMYARVPEDQHFILSTLAPSPAQKRLAVALVIVLLAVYVMISARLLSGVHTSRVDAFMPAYLTAMFVCDSITAVLLYAQFAILRSRGILIIASGYVFTALILIPYALGFPGVFAATAIMGGLQSAASLYVIWHCGFPLFVIVYALAKDSQPGSASAKSSSRAAILWSLGLTAALVLSAAVICTAGEAYLPPIMIDNVRFGPQWPYLVGAPIALVCIIALVVLWIHRRSTLDLWLLVVMFLYLIEVPLSYYPAPTRFSGGWYAVRIFGFLASSIVMMALLHEITTLYSRVFNAVLAQRREREARLMTGDAVAASIAHEVRQPLTAMVTTADAGLRFLDRHAPNVDKAKEAFRRIVADGHRAGDIVESIRTTFRNDARDRTPVDLNELIHETLDLGRAELQKHGIRVHAEQSNGLPEVRGNRVQLQQVVLNLIMNAVEAMAARDEPRILSVKSEPCEDDRVIVSIADTGAGISASDAERIFSPLFTTKSGGMGMGLSICRAIIEAHEGRLWFAPNSPRGAVFQFTLPNTSAAAAV